MAQTMTFYSLIWDSGVIDVARIPSLPRSLSIPLYGIHSFMRGQYGEKNQKSFYSLIWDYYAVYVARGIDAETFLSIPLYGIRFDFKKYEKIKEEIDLSIPLYGIT